MRQRNGQNLNVKAPRPYPFQDEDLDRMDELLGRVMLCWDLGLGKSGQAIRWIKRHGKDALPAVVVCPAFLKFQWADQAHLFGSFRSDILDGTRPATRNGHTPPITIVNPDILGQRRSEHCGPGQLRYLKSLQPKTIIVDEGQMFGSFRAKRTKWLHELCRGVPHVIALSATPLTSQPSQLYPILNLLRPDKWNSWPKFGQRYCGPTMQYGYMVYKGATNLDELNRKMLRRCMIRRRKIDVLAELPKLTKETVPLPISSTRRYAQARDNFIEWLSKEHPNRVYRAMALQRLVQFGYLLRLTAKLKMKAALEWIDNFLESENEKLAIFTMHKKTIRRLRRRYRRISVKVDGSVPMAKRRDAVRKFQNDPECQLFIGNILAAGTGLDGLQQACSNGVFLELPLVPAHVSQVMGRLDRLGQKKPVTFTFLVAQGTIETSLCKVLVRRSKILAEVLDGTTKTADLEGIFDVLEKEIKA